MKFSIQWPTALLMHNPRKLRSSLEAIVWIADDADHSPASPGAGSARFILTVDDPDAVFARAIAAGGTVVNDMYEDHGWRIGRLTDPSGHDWEIARQLGW